VGEARRRKAYDTLDGGPPSDDKIVLQVEVFDPWDLSDRLRHTAALEVIEKLERGPTPICGACEYEFGRREMPAALYCLRPMFPKAEAYTFVGGAICPQYAALPTNELMEAILCYWRSIKPDATIVAAGTA
jgi:hypothetical protein